MNISINENLVILNIFYLCLLYRYKYLMYVDCIYYILMLLIMEVVICRIVMEYVLNCFLNVILCNKEIDINYFI